MDYFDKLRKGSEFHKARLINDRAFSIHPVGEGPDPLRQFQEVVLEAIRNETSDYEVKPHRQHMVDLPGWHGPIYDFVAITKIT